LDVRFRARYKQKKQPQTSVKQVEGRKVVNLKGRPCFPHWDTQKNNFEAQLAYCVGFIIFD
jgi:hypothetical protein